MTNPLVLILIGVIVGIYSGIMGLGGGTIMIPVMVLALGFTQKQALGTSLAVMLPPVALPAVIQYYRHGHIDIRVALWMALGFALGATLGGFFANKLPDLALKLIFAFVLVYVAGYMMFNALGRNHIVRNMLLAAVLAGVAAAFFLVVRWYDRGHDTPAQTAQSQTT